MQIYYRFSKETLKIDYGINDIMELNILKIFRESGKELVLLRVEEDTNLWPFIIFDATYDEKGISSNLLRHSFFFPSQNVKRYDYVIVYTGKGETHHFKNRSGSTTWVYYWGLDINVWNNKISSLSN